MILRSLCFLLACLLFLDSASRAEEFVSIGSRRELFVDGSLIESMSGGARRELHHPIPREVVITHDAPWEGTGCGYHSIFKDGDKYKMFYKAWHLKTLENGVAPGDNYFACYAESDDGIHWTKPNLGIHEIKGSKENNVILTRFHVGEEYIDPAHIAVFKDPNPDCPPDTIYKAIVVAHRDPRKMPEGLLPLKSADGIHWEAMSQKPVITQGAFDSQNLAFWDGERREYRAYWRYFNDGKKTYRLGNGHRDILTATSKDFLNWSEPTPLTYSDERPDQLYVNQVLPYARAPHLLIGFPVRYLDRGVTESMSHLPDLEHRQKRIKTSERYGTAMTEALLMSSRNGVQFERWPEAFLRPGIQRPGTWNYGQQYIAWHPVETASDLPGAPPELSLYATENYWLGNGSCLRRYTLRLDGFVSLTAPLSGGEVVTKPVTFAGSELELNFSSSVAGEVRVQLEDANGNVIPGFSLADCEPIYGDELARTVVWQAKPELKSLTGKSVKLRFLLKDADLYSFRFGEKEE